MQNIKLKRPIDRIRTAALAVALAALFLLCIGRLDLDLERFTARLGNAGNILGRMAHIDASKLPAALSGMVLSIAVALAGLAMGLAVSLVLSFLAARNTTPHRALSAAIKAFVAVIRAIPALVWILMIVASLGFGNTAGVMGLLFPTVGYLTKSFVASIEERGNDTIEAMRSTGADWLQIVCNGLMPGLMRPFASWIAIRLEGNIAESISLGMVGIGGIGALLMKAVGKYDYAALTTIVLVIFATMFLVETGVNWMKKRL